MLSSRNSQRACWDDSTSVLMDKREKPFQPLTEQIALLHQGNLLFHGGLDPKELAHFIEGSTEA